MPKNSQNWHALSILLLCMFPYCYDNSNHRKMFVLSVEIVTIAWNARNHGNAEPESVRRVFWPLEYINIDNHNNWYLEALEVPSPASLTFFGRLCIGERRVELCCVVLSCASGRGATDYWNIAQQCASVHRGEARSIWIASHALVDMFRGGCVISFCTSHLWQVTI